MVRWFPEWSLYLVGISEAGYKRKRLVMDKPDRR